ncbi:hypothetical protein ECC02_010578 [Trypanosoma cruzi]|uniref:Uncharacterized protein n=1 Tax=Trypanosoma cruzi TaxID=5693 RepID=A0A7J6XQX2_TRYCR|nr:hypothetical protein ECC02_010578 [Trypanosoma cruzi]
MRVCQWIYFQSSCATQLFKESNGSEKPIAHTQITHIITHKHTHAARGMGALNRKTIKENKKPKRGTTSAHTLIAPVKQNTHTGRERERSPTQCNGNKTETVTVLRPCSQAGRQRCVSCKREHQRACMGVHAYIQWAHYVCASWDEVRARVHARGHTQRVGERRVCVRAVHGSLSLTLTRPPPQQQPHTQQEEEAKEGRWCGRQRCCRHCFVCSSYQLCWRLLSLLSYLPQSLLSLCHGGFVVWLRTQATEHFFDLHSWCLRHPVRGNQHRPVEEVVRDFLPQFPQAVCSPRYQL